MAYDDYYDGDYEPYQDVGMDEEDDSQIEISNLFTEAEDEFNTNKQEAYNKFSQVIEKEKALDPSKSKEYSFKSSMYLIILSLELRKSPQDLPSLVDSFIFLMKDQYQNEVTEALNKIIDVCSSTESQGVDLTISSILGKLKSEKIFQSHYCSSELRLCKAYLTKRNFNSLERSLQNITQLVESTDIDQEKKKSVMMQVTAYKILLFKALRQNQMIKPLYRQLLQLNYTLYEPNIVGIIQLTIGEFKALERQYKQSREAFTNAFQSFQEACNHEYAKQALQYSSVVSILENYRMNLFDDVRSKAYDKEESMEMFKQLRIAYEMQNISRFNEILNSPAFIADEFLIKLQPNLQQVSIECKILRIVQAYSRIKIDYLCKTLQLNRATLLREINGLIARRGFQATIDEVDGYIEMTSQKEDDSIPLRTIIEQVTNDF